MSDAIQQAVTLMQQRRYTEAAQLVRTHLAQQPDDPEAQGLLMQVQEKMMLEMQIKQKLQQARELLFDGKGAEARAAAQEILGIDPGHPEAEEILRSASGGGDDPPLMDAAGFEVAEAPVLDAGGFAVADAPQLDAGGFAVAETPLMGADDFGGGSAAPMEIPSAGGGFGDFSAPPAAGGNSALSAAEQAKVKDFLDKGRTFIAAGSPQDAVDILTRVFIIDENNAEAQQLIDQARAAMDSAGAAVDHEVNEAIGAFNAGDFNRAKTLFGEVLKRTPDHAEALGYLGQIASREAAFAAPSAVSGASDAFEIEAGADAIPDSAPEPEPAPQAAPQPARPAPGEMPVARRPLAPEAPAPASAARKGGGVPVWAVGLLVLLLFGAGGGVLFVLKMRNRPPAPAPEPVVKAPVAPAPAPVVSAPEPVAPAPPPEDPHLTELKALIAGGDSKLILAQAGKEFDALQYGNVRMLLQGVFDKFPNDPAALAFKQKTDTQEQSEKDYQGLYDEARAQLGQNNFDEALRLAWKLRHPPETLRPIATRLQLWDKAMQLWSACNYNVAVARLRNGNLDEGETLLGDYDEAYAKMGLPKDEQVEALRKTVREFRGKPLDKTYYTFVNGLAFRPAP